MIKNFKDVEICCYSNGESYRFPLTEMQFAIVSNILGLRINPDESFGCFSDDTLKHIAKIKGIPLKLEAIDLG